MESIFEPFKDVISLFKKIVKSFPYAFNITVISMVVFVLLLSFYKGLPAFVGEIIIPALAIYIIGTGFISGLRIEFTVYDNTKEKTKTGEPKGITRSHFTIVIFAHTIWFLLFAGYIIYRCIFVSGIV